MLSETVTDRTSVENVDSFEIMLSSVKYWFRWIIGGIAIPLAFPWLVFHLYKSHFRNKVYKNCAFQDKVVLITGASSGIGEALAHAFYKAGAKVILAARRVENLEKVKADLLAEHLSDHEPVVLSLDLHELQEIPTKVAEILQMLGKIDILINNGGISFRGEIAETELQVDLQVMVVNYFGPVALTKAVLPSMLERNSGSIIAVSSVQGKIAIPFRSAYSASKHATQAFFDTLKSELGHTDIHVCVVSPGYVQTNLSLNAIRGDGSKHGVMDETTASGMDPKEIAETILEAIISKHTEVIACTMLPKFAVLLRVLWPSLYFYFTRGRAMRIREKMKSA